MEEDQPLLITDISVVDLLTLARMNQNLLYFFLSKRLNDPNTLLNEVLLQGLMYEISLSLSLNTVLQLFSKVSHIFAAALRTTQSCAELYCQVQYPDTKKAFGI